MNVLFLGAHPDDVEAGCLCTLLNHQKAKDGVHYILMSDGDKAKRSETRAEEYKKVLEKLPGIVHKNLHLPDTRLHDTENREMIRRALEKKRDSCDIDIIYSHWINDIHQDHKTVAEECIRIFRYKTILQYEIVHSCPRFEPNCYIEINETEKDKKMFILNLFNSQKSSCYFNAKNFESTIRFRGEQAGFKYAEAFIIWRLCQPRRMRVL